MSVVQVTEAQVAQTTSASDTVTSITHMDDFIDNCSMCGCSCHSMNMLVAITCAVIWLHLAASQAKGLMAQVKAFHLSACNARRFN